MPVTHEKQTPNKPEAGAEKKPLRERSPLLWLFVGGVVGALGFYLVKRMIEGPLDQQALPPAPGYPPPPPQGYYPPPPPPPPGYAYPPWWRG
jgi:hypothetical protein